MSDKLATILAKAGHYFDEDLGGMIPPVSLNSTYARDDDYGLRHDRQYGRADNPTFEVAENILSTLEGGADALVFPSGLAAMAAIASLMQRGERIVISGEGYFGVRGWMQRESKRVGFSADLFDPTEDGDLERVLATGNAPRFVWIETPANPTWTVVDIAACAEAAHGVGAKLIVDATVMTPLICQPIKLGADLVMHSATKYLNGHSDIVAGALITAKDDADWQAIKEVRYHAGPILGPFEAWLLIRGMRTMHLRVKRASDSALAIATALEGHEKLSHVLYPGLESHPGHSIAWAQSDADYGFGGMLSVRLKGGFDAAKAFTLGTKQFTPATSLGGVESLIEHRKPVEGPDSPTPDDLVRLSIGIEDVGDLIADLKQSLSKV